MAQLTNSFATYDAVGLRESLADAIYNIAPEETPFVSAIGKGKAEAVYEEWQTDDLEAAINNKVEQGNEAAPAAITPTVRMGNRTQISEKVFAVTGTEEVVRKAGRRSEVAYQDAKKMVELKRDVEFACLQNTTAIAAASGVAPQSRGALGWIATNTNIADDGANPNPLTNTAPTDGTLRELTEAMLQDIGQKAWEQGGNPTMLLVPSGLRAKVSAFTGSATKFENVKEKRITATAEIYVGDFGRYSIVNSRHQRQREIFLLEPGRWTLLTLRPMRGQDLAKTGDNKKRLINTEYTLKCHNEKANGAIRDVQANPVSP